MSNTITAWLCVAAIVAVVLIIARKRAKDKASHTTITNPPGTTPGKPPGLPAEK